MKNANFLLCRHFFFSCRSDLDMKGRIFSFQVHFIGRDYDQLHKLVPRELLPEEYGGTLDNYDYDELERAMLSTDTFFVELGKHGYREQRAQKESTEL